MFLNKKIFYSLSMILLLSMTLIIAFASPSFAQVGVPQPEKTTGYISVAPTLIGVGQNATVNLFVYPLPTTYLYAPYFKGFNGITVTFTKPDGTKDTFMPVDGTGQYVAGQTQSVGTLYFFYAPGMAGNWSVTFTMPAQNITDSSGTVMYQACTSNTAYFTVQSEPVLAGILNGYPWSPLPNENTFWSYPISSNNREWNTISGEWLQGFGITSFGNLQGVTCRLWQPYGTGPNTAHVVWSQPIRPGGIIGGDYGSLSYTAGFTSIGNVVMQGKVFANIEPDNSGSTVNKFVCIDLTTGQILYTADGSITCGLHLPGNPFVQSIFDPSVVLASSFGSIPTPYLFGASGTNWNYYDPFTGKLIRSISNATTTLSFGSYLLVDGTNLAYGVGGGNFFAWDVSKVVNNNWPTGIVWTRPLPKSMLSGSTSLVGNIQAFGLSKDLSTIVLKTLNEYWGYNIKDGTQLWNLTLTYPVATNEEISLYGVNDFIVWDPTYSTFHCYSMLTGRELWVSDSFADSTWATTWTIYNSETNDNENLYLAFPDGTIAALSLATGKTLWRSEPFHSTEYPNNVVPYVCGMLMVGGNIYAYAGYSVLYQINPMPRFGMMSCVNATTGDIIYNLNGGIYPTAAANGYVLGFGQYDGNLYCVGKGPTSTTVTAQQQIGGSVLIQGSVLDTSPASTNADTAMFPNGVPAISDANMSVWMDYLHMQNATSLNAPPDCIGVSVTLSAVDPNGNTINVGNVKTDNSGQFAYQWTPITAGVYTVYATFGGTNAYFSSYGETHATVASASSSTPAPTSGTQSGVSNSDIVTYLAIGVVAIIIAIAIVGVLLLRKR